MPSMMENILMRKCNLPYKKAKKIVAQARENLNMSKQSVLWSRELEVECIRVFDEEKKLAPKVLKDPFDIQPTLHVVRSGVAEAMEPTPAAEIVQSRNDEDAFPEEIFQEQPFPLDSPPQQPPPELQSANSIRQKKRGKSAGRAPGRRRLVSPQKRTSMLGKEDKCSDDAESDTDFIKSSQNCSTNEGEAGDSEPKRQPQYSSPKGKRLSLAGALAHVEKSHLPSDETSSLWATKSIDSGSSDSTGTSRFRRTKRTDDRRQANKYLNHSHIGIDNSKGPLDTSQSSRSSSLSPSKKGKKKVNAKLVGVSDQTSSGSGLMSPTKKKKKKKKKDKELEDSTHTRESITSFLEQNHPQPYTNILSPNRDETPHKPRVDKSPRKTPRRTSVQVSSDSLMSKSSTGGSTIPQHVFDAVERMDSSPSRAHSNRLLVKVKKTPRKKPKPHQRDDNLTPTKQQDSSRSLVSESSAMSKTKMMPVIRRSPGKSPTKSSEGKLNRSMRSCGSNRKSTFQRRPSDFEVCDPHFVVSPTKGLENKYATFFTETSGSPESFGSIDSFSGSECDAFSPPRRETTMALPNVPSLSPTFDKSLVSLDAPRQPKRQISDMGELRKEFRKQIR